MRLFEPPKGSKKRQAMQLFDLCLSRVNDIVVITESAPLSEPGPRIIFVNDAFERHTGYTRSEVIGRSPRFLQGPATNLEELRRIGVALQNHSPVRAEIVNYKKDGKLFWIEIDIVPIFDAKGHCTHFVSIERDVTTRKHAEQSLTEAGERLQFALDAADIGDWNMDLRTNVMVRSLQHDRCFGYIEPVPDWNYGTFLSHVYAPDRNRFDSAYQNALSGKSVFDVEFRVMWPDHTLHWLWTKGRVYFSEFDEPLRVAGIVADVTQRRLTEESRRETTTRLQLATEASNTGLWDWDLKTNEVYFSPIWKSQLGYADHEINNSLETWKELLHPDDIERATSAIDRYLACPDKNYENNFRLRHKDGTYRWIVARASGISNEQGALTRMIGVHIDLTESRNAENALNAIRDRFRGVIEASPVPYALNDDQQNILYLNPAFSNTFGYTIADIPTVEHWRRLAFPDVGYRDWVVSTWMQHMEVAKRTQQVFEPFEMTVTCKDGSLRRIMGRTAVFSGSFDASNLVVFFDVTESRRVEQRIIEAATAEQHRLGLDLHDGLGQELTGLSMMLAALSRKDSGAEETEIQSELAALAVLAGRCVQTARSIAQGLSPVEIASAGLPDALHRLVASATNTGSVRCSLRLDGIEQQSLPSGLTEGIYRIVQEALANAIKHSGATQVAVQMCRVKDNLTFSVADNGHGMKVTGERGGMGLSIMRYRARALGGNLTIESQPAGGTLVSCSCPIPAFGNSLMGPAEASRQ